VDVAYVDGGFHSIVWRLEEESGPDRCYGSPSGTRFDLGYDFGLGYGSGIRATVRASGLRFAHSGFGSRTATARGRALAGGGVNLTAIGYQ
jgi:hypothetical protein